MSKKSNLRRRKASGRAKKISEAEYRKRKRRQIRRAGYVVFLVAEINRDYLQRRSRRDFLRLVIDREPKKSEFGYKVIYRYFVHDNVKKELEEAIVLALIEWATKGGSLVNLPRFFDKVVGKAPKSQMKFIIERSEED